MGCEEVWFHGRRCKTEAYVVEGPIEKIASEEKMEATREKKLDPLKYVQK